MNKIFISFLPLAAAITILAGTFYIGIQQVYRISANDPQIQIAQDVANQTLSGQNPLNYVPSYKIELSKSLATYIMVFDKNGNLLGSSVLLNGKQPILPKGVFTDTKNSSNKEKRFTWQPESGIRSALVIDYFSGKQEGFVAVGRSLNEVEKRVNNLTQITFLGWALTIIVSFVLKIFVKKSKNFEKK